MMKACQRLPRYRLNKWVPVMAATKTDFEFTEGHIRILLWMCDSHQDWIDAASAKIMQNGEMPSDNLMRCREGIADLKCWAFRLLDVIEATPNDEDDEDDGDLDDDDEHLSRLEDFGQTLEEQWRVHRNFGGRSAHPLQKLRRWLLSVLG